MSQILRILIYLCLISILSFVGIAQEQQKKWFYIGTSADKQKFYYQKGLVQLETGGSALWGKSVYADDSYSLTLSEIDCSHKRFRDIQKTTYSSSDRFLSEKKNLDWGYISPDSVAESYRLIFCENKVETDKAEIISIEANLRKSPTKSSTVLRTAKKGDRFALSFGKPVAGWYNIVDEKTQEDYWVHGNAIKIIPNENKTTSQKTTLN
jgi:uncharacterized protein YgiM (DUF1202 family)